MNDGNYLFPFLNKGNKTTFGNDDIKIDIIYDQILPRKKEDSQKDTNPLYLIGQHFRPDIVIHLYYKKKICILEVSY